MSHQQVKEVKAYKALRYDHISGRFTSAFDANFDYNPGEIVPSLPYSYLFAFRSFIYAKSFVINHFSAPLVIVECTAHRILGGPSFIPSSTSSLKLEFWEWYNKGIGVFEMRRRLPRVIPVPDGTIFCTKIIIKKEDLKNYKTITGTKMWERERVVRDARRY